MQAVETKEVQQIIVRKIEVEITQSMNCEQAKEKLVALLSGDELLEETHVAVKSVLFRHLENCSDCCRAFDVRARFRTLGRDRIF